MRLLSMCGWALALAVTATTAWSATPTPPPPTEVTDRAPGHGERTWLDLLTQVIPDLAEDAASGKALGHLKTPVRHLAGPSSDESPPDLVEAQYIEVQRIKAGGRPRILVLADLGPAQNSVSSYTLLALFDDGATPRLLDVVDIGLDRFTSFSEQARLRLSPGDDAVVTYSEHSNSSQTYSSWMVAYVRGDSLALAAKVFGLSSRECGWERLETPTFSAHPDPGRALRRIDIVVREARTRDSEAGCDQPPPKAYVRLWRASYRWEGSQRRFVTPSRDLGRLAKRNERWF
jgi:hypothetical protein